MFTIVKKTEQLPIGGITITIYGDAGTGKTTLANTARNPIVIDFDNGYHRAAYRQEFVPISSWRDIADHQAEFFAAIADYDTIVIDTVGAMLDYLQIYLVEQNPKLEKATMQMYGELKKNFQDFHRKLMAMGKDIVFIAHAKEKEENEQRIKRPLLVGSSYDLVVQKSDLVGYMTVLNGRTILDFDASETKIGKNCANLDPMPIGSLADVENFMDNLIQKVKASLQRQSEEQEESINKIKVILSELQTTGDIDSINAFVSKVKASRFTKVEKLQIWEHTKKHGESLGFVYNAKAAKFTNQSEEEAQ
jgi:hypothetical protein